MSKIYTLLITKRVASSRFTSNCTSIALYPSLITKFRIVSLINSLRVGGIPGVSI